MNGAELLSRYIGWMLLLLLLINGPESARSSPCVNCDTGEGVDKIEERQEGNVGSATQELTDQQHPATSGYWLEPIRGLKVGLARGELSIRFSPFSRSDENAVESRGKEDDEKEPKDKKMKMKKGGGMMQKIGKMMMMVPMMMQMVQMPMKMAEIKWLLLRSILVGKVAIVLILIRTLMMMKGQQDTKIVVLRAPQKEMHEHFYHHMEDPEDSKPGWLETKEDEKHHGEVHEHPEPEEDRPKKMVMTMNTMKGMKGMKSMKYEEDESPSAEDAVKGLEKYMEWFKGEWDEEPVKMSHSKRYRNRASHHDLYRNHNLNGFRHSMNLTNDQSYNRSHNRGDSIDSPID